MKKKPSSVAVVAFLLCVCFTRQLHALGPLEIEVGAKGGYASVPPYLGLPRPFGTGLGGRVGASLLPFYCGLDVQFYHSDGDEATFVNTLQYGVEAGYRITVLDDYLSFGAQLGAGVLDINVGQWSVSSRSIGAYFEPALTALLWLDWFYLGLTGGVIFPVVQYTQPLDPPPFLVGQLGFRFELPIAKKAPSSAEATSSPIRADMPTSVGDPQRSAY